MKLIQTKEYLLWVDETAPIEAMKTPVWNEVAGWMGKHEKVEDFFCTYSISKEYPSVNDINVFDAIHKIIGHLPLGDSKPLEGVLLLPDLYCSCKGIFCENPFDCTAEYKTYKGTFSLEDMRNAVKYGAENAHYGLQHDTKARDNKIDSYIESLSTSKLPIGFEPEYEQDDIYPGSGGIRNFLKTIKTPKGEQIIGRYIYE